MSVIAWGVSVTRGLLNWMNGKRLSRPVNWLSWLLKNWRLLDCQRT